MRIAILFDAWDVVWWWRTHVENICNILQRDYNCEIDIYTRNLIIEDETHNKIQYLYEDKVRIFRCWAKTQFFNLYWRFNSLFSILFLFFKNYKRYKYDIIHAHSPLLFPIGKLLSVITKIPIVITNHWANILDKWEKNLMYYFENWILTKIKYDCEITVWSSFLKYKNVNKPVVIWNWVNIEEFIVNKNVLKNKLKKFLFVWRLEWTKWVDILIKAIDFLVKEKYLNNFILNIVWYWYDEEKYKQEVKNLWLENYINFKWKIIWKELAKIYSESDIMLVSSRTEWFGIMVLEAMASWIPVISTKCWWPEDIIIDWKNGFLVENENYKRFSETIENVLEMDLNQINKITYTAYWTIKQKYTRKIITRKINDIYINIKKF